MSVDVMKRIPVTMTNAEAIPQQVASYLTVEAMTFYSTGRESASRSLSQQEYNKSVSSHFFLLPIIGIPSLIAEYRGGFVGQWKLLRCLYRRRDAK